jgi:eukaryotic-like serine/threonine-protein kinase
VLAASALFYFRVRRSAPQIRSSWVQITAFADGATSPALSPDGRMVAFIRGPETFVSPGQIYVKMLPDGEPVQLTHDNSPKMAPVFSPDGSRIAYTATDGSFGWNTWIVPVLGGEPKELLPNAAALSWTDPQHVMFSEIKTRGPMGIAAAGQSRGEERDVYLPAIGMAHRSWISPNGKWVLISEMDKIGWRPCRLVPFDGSTVGETVGPPKTRCTYAGWSPDGATMYFSADAGDGYHIWRQHFPSGTPERLTFGATEEEGIAIFPDGRSLITSAGIRESTVWLHDQRGDRQISGEGFASMPGLGFGIASAHSTFSPDGKRLYYLVRGDNSRAWTSGELWMADIDSGHNESVLPGVSMSGFDIGPDGQRVAFWAPDAGGISRAWVAPLDRRSPPKQLTSSEARWPSFGPGGEIYVLMREGAQQFVSSIGPDGIAHRTTTADPNQIFTADSPKGDFLLTGFSPLIAQPVQEGSPIPICSFCSAGWGPGAGFLYLRFRGVGEMGPGKTIVIGLPPGKELPELPSSGLNSVEEAERLHVVAEINTTGMTYFVPGPDPSIYAYVRATTQRNLFRIPLD